MHRKAAIAAAVVGLVIFASVGALIWLGSGDNGLATNVVQVRHMKATNFGCQKLDTVDQFTKMDAEGDEAAALDYIRQNMATGECEELPQGTLVYVEDAKLTGLSKVRPKGETIAYWTMSEVVGP